MDYLKHGSPHRALEIWQHCLSQCLARQTELKLMLKYHLPCWIAVEIRSTQVPLIRMVTMRPDATVVSRMHVNLQQDLAMRVFVFYIGFDAERSATKNGYQLL